MYSKKNRTFERLVGLHRAHTAFFLVCCKRKYNFCLCYRVDAKKIKVVNAQINLPKLHTKYQSIHTLSKNSHVDDR